ncbi:MAG: hypothetical protein ABEH59_02010 [Halobacteriales archaeon]
MSQAREWYRWKRRGSTELFLLWAMAAITYGGGDILTTLILVYAIQGLGEANPFIHWGLATFGPLGLLAAKLLVFGLGFAVSRRGLAQRDRLLYYVPPVLMILVGLAATAVNLRLIF